jgi:hypothetical protein
MAGIERCKSTMNSATTIARTSQAAKCNKNMKTRSPTGELADRAGRKAAAGFAVTSSALSCDMLPVFAASNG